MKIKEPMNALTHFVPFVAAWFGLVSLLLLSYGSLSKTITMAVYGLSVIGLYGTSSLYHALPCTPKKELILRKIDHMMIYILIGGSYTPVFYYGLEGAWRWAMLIAVWALALIGVLLKIWFINAPRYVSTAFYVTLGWIALVPIVQLVHNLPLGALIMMVVGGVMYTVGAIIYAAKIFRIPRLHLGFHEIFHIFIAAGTLIHFLMVLIYIVPMAS
ncbi:channel protein, hemolysin III family [Desulfitobacterium dichloroeliminans LMG P-21439]|uniref:Channel protein, hemolysin III family n=1 Tax=Desulfitobacterium dichloroeliminans (strain LMG P-21439 / DCA1) TaxID=871963 RepID=L0F687_DESDL|nr:hemolysin III family protein [Desulfitobacterium dichloroeliminans]AGA68473.1 channel protein, hemolysin III family [Desulfitobacterium dichloroeliminans LMG P-21439]